MHQYCYDYNIRFDFRIIAICIGTRGGKERGGGCGYLYINYRRRHRA